MKKFYPPILIILVIFASCGKELSTETNSNAQRSLAGTWNFISMSGKTSSTGQYSSSGSILKVVTYSDYVTLNNKGKVLIDATTMTTQGISYTIDTVARSYFFINNHVTDSLLFPFRLTVPPTSNTSPYKVVGSDSLYFTNGGPFTWGSNGGVSTQPPGFKFSISGKRMTLQSSLSGSYTDSTQGFPMAVVDQATFAVILEKQ